MLKPAAPTRVAQVDIWYPLRTVNPHTFDLLTPYVVVNSVQEAFALRLDGMLTAYPSYVNRVYGLADEDGKEYIVKFYRPGRWSLDAIDDEHQFVIDCAEADLPVVAPIADDEGVTLQSVTAAEGDREVEYAFALFPKRSGRSFDAEGDEDWNRLGSLIGRIHTAAALRDAPFRLVCTPEKSTVGFVDELEEAGIVHPDCREEFFRLAREYLQWISPIFAGVASQRIHGDCHRGNILDRPGEGLLIIDFDDMMMGPAVQDLWLLLPDKAQECARELELILEGYQNFRPFDPASLRLIEPLRLMRMLYYLAWSARQRDDRRFRESFPEWGGEAFWIKEIEDLRTQIEVIHEELG